MNLLSFVMSMFIFSLLLGILIGNGLTTRAQDTRSRRQANVQRPPSSRQEALWSSTTPKLSRLLFSRIREARSGEATPTSTADAGSDIPASAVVTFRVLHHQERRSPCPTFPPASATPPRP